MVGYSLAIQAMTTVDSTHPLLLATDPKCEKRRGIEFRLTRTGDVKGLVFFLLIRNRLNRK